MSPADQPIAIGLLVVSALAFAVWVTEAARRARRDRQAEEAVEWPVHDYLGAWECRVVDCDRTASVWVEQPYAGRMFVCRTCATDGAALGWFGPPECPACGEPEWPSARFHVCPPGPPD